MPRPPTILTIETPSLGDRSYLAHDGEVALVVDPQRDIDRVLTVAERAGVRITHVFETHIHNDYLTGGLALARHTGAAYCLNADDEVAFARTPLRDGDLVDVSDSLRLKVIATPGHTFTHLSYALETPDETPDDGPDPSGPGAVCVFTGGSLLLGATGRPDLLGERHTDALARHQFHSSRRLAAELPESAAVLPTHGFGSFCSSGPSSGADTSTIGQEKRVNPVLSQDEARWVAATIAGLDVYPAYYAHMGPANAAGPAAPDLSVPAPATPAALTARLAAGDWVVDVRSRAAFAAGHAEGTVNVGVDGQLATYVGWLLPWGTPLTLLGESPEQLADARRELVRIGVDAIAGAASGAPQRWADGPVKTLPRKEFVDLAAARSIQQVAVLDVRRASEYASQHVQNAVNIPIHELPDRLPDVPPGPVWVHCASGYRASIAASLLAARDVDVVLVDDDFAHASASGLPMTPPVARPPA